MKVAVLGGGSFSTPRLVRCLAARRDTGPLTLVLAGRTAARLEAVGRASAILAEGSRVRVETALAADGGRPSWLEGCAAVLVQVRAGGYEARRYDETFPLEFGLCGDEGLGPGGLAAAWRAWPVLRSILRDAAALCPGARILLLTSPIGLLARLAGLAFPALRLHGICELPFTTLRAAAGAEGLDWREVDWQYLGINHIGWLYGMRAPDGRALRAGRPLPLKYLRLRDSSEAVLAEQRAAPGARAAELSALARRAIDIYARGTRSDIEEALAMRTADWYDAAAGPMIAYLAGGDAGAVFFLSAAQGLWRPEFAPGDVLEIPHAPACGSLVPRPNPVAPPAEIVEALQRLLRYERAAAAAVLERDPAAIEHALSLHPWVPPSVPVRDLAARVCGGPVI